MPTPIDQCSSCGRQVFAEDKVAGACDCSERSLRLLLAQERRKNAANLPTATGSVHDHQSLSEVPPELWMSPSGLRELEAAQTARPLLGRTASSGPEGVRTASQSVPDLEALWLAETGIPYDPDQITPAVADDFEFDTAEDIDIETAGARARFQAGRFRVDQPPEHVPFNRSFAAGLMGGPMRETARVRGGRFAVLSDATPVGHPEPSHLRQREASQTPRAQVKPPVDRSALPTAYHRLRDGWLDDQ
jgi:hypothetical protein